MIRLHLCAITVFIQCICVMRDDKLTVPRKFILIAVVNLTPCRCFYESMWWMGVCTRNDTKATSFPNGGLSIELTTCSFEELSSAFMCTLLCSHFGHSDLKTICFVQLLQHLSVIKLITVIQVPSYLEWIAHIYCYSRLTAPILFWLIHLPTFFYFSFSLSR